MLKQLVIVVVIALLGLACFNILSANDAVGIQRYVLSNQQELEAFVEDHDWDDPEGTVMRYGTFEVSAWNDAAMIQFQVASFGFGSTSSYKGFYYVRDGSPVGFQGAKLPFSVQGPGLYWTDGTDNWQHVEKICDNWYWFEASF